MKIDIWSDLVCPYCYLGKRRLETALAQFAHRDQVELVWHSFELDPYAPAVSDEGTSEMLSRKYGIPLQQARASQRALEQQAAAVGLEFHLETTRTGNTFDAHRLIHLARSHGRQDELKDRLFAATFTEGRPIGDHEMLVELALEAGVPEADARRVLSSDEYADDVRADEADAVEVGVDGVPFFLIDRRFMIPGAQTPETVLAILERAWRKAQTVEP